MARVLVATQSWGVLWERASDRRLSTPVAGQLAAIDTTVYAASSGGTVIAPGSFVTNADGELPGYVDEGHWTLTVGTESFPVAALGGTLPERVDDATAAAAAAIATSEAASDAVAEEGQRAASAEAAIAESLDGHLAEMTDAHNASAVSVVPSGSLTGTNAQAALEALAVRGLALESRHRVLGEFSTLTTGMAVFAGELVVNANVLNERLADGALESPFDQALWKPVGGGGLQVAAEVSADGALVVGKLTPVNATSGARTMTLPTGAATGTLIAAQKSDASTNTVVLSGSIRGSAGTLTIKGNRFETQALVADASGSWWPYADHKTWTSIDAEIAALAAGGGATSAFAVGRTTPVATPLPRPGLVPMRVPGFARSMASSVVSNGTDTKEYSVRAYRAVCSGEGIRVLLPNYAANNQITVTGAVVSPDGNTSPLQTPGGRRTIVIDTYSHVIAEASLRVTVGDVIMLRIFVEPRDAAGALIASGVWSAGTINTAQAVLGETVVRGASASDLTLASAGSQPAAAVGAAFAPLAMWLARTDGLSKPVIGAHGDSITAGTGDDQSLANGPGFLARALAGNYPFVNIGVPGVLINYATAAGIGGRALLPALGGCTTIYDASGANHLTIGGITDTAIIDLKLAAWRVLSLTGARVRTCTLFPRDGIAAAGLAAWVGYNNWVRDGGPINPDKTRAAIGATGGILRFGDTGHYVHGYDDIADATATNRTAATYKPGYSDDGTHPNAVGAAAAGAAVSLSALI